jgi:copper ion binding protein
VSERTYMVKGMTCDHCVRSVTEEIGRVTGVQSVAVDLQSGRVVVTSAHPVDDDAVAAAIDEAGYELVPRAEP